MPKRSLNSSVFRWPAAGEVEAAARAWAREIARRDPTIRRIVCFGSLASGRWGVGSDLDIFVEVSSSDLDSAKRSLRYDTSGLPVQADVIVQTSDEVERMRAEGRRFAREIDERGITLYPDPGALPEDTAPGP